MTTNNPEIAQRVRHLRMTKGLSQKQLAGRAGISEASVYRIENGRIKTPRILAGMAKVLGVSSSYLETGVDDSVPKSIANGSIIVRPYLANQELIPNGLTIPEADKAESILLPPVFKLEGVTGREHGLRYIMCSDDAMSETIPPNSMLIFNTLEHTWSSGVYILRINRRILCRRTQPKVSGLHLTCDNSKYSDELVDHNAVGVDIEVIGRCLYALPFLKL